ncbi:hypothetical protein MNBD_UNCLBAC01-1952 [hydrothermal vent metagenome]|uniref:PilZ domain-containing protein n=1 Tax=hydrothermal vent metagenome TaxID=652676 RepID=A0A3B1DYN2_9ZZZZ
MDSSTQKIRKFKRIALNAPVQFERKDILQSGGSLSHNICSGGIRINFNEFVPLQTEILLEVQLASKQILECFGKVVWVEKERYNDHYQVGIEFDSEKDVY